MTWKNINPRLARLFRFEPLSNLKSTVRRLFACLNDFLLSSNRALV